MIGSIFRVASGWETVIPLADFFIKSALLMLFAFGALHFMRRRSPALRHAVIRSAFVSLLLLTCLLPILPSREIASFVHLPVGSLSNTVTNPVPGPEVTSSGPSFSYLIILAALVYATGCIVLAARFIFARAVVSRLHTSGRSVDDPKFLRASDDLMRDLSIKRRLRFYASNAVSVPIVTGTVRPAILLPPNYASWTVDRRDMILRHELAHVKRHDVFWMNFAAVLTILHWFNPLGWIMRNRMRLESELACDNYVLAAGAGPRHYARSLVRMARESSRPRRKLNAGIAFLRKSQLEGRIMAILDARSRVLAPSPLIIAFIAAIAFVVVSPMAMTSLLAGDDSGDIAERSTDTSLSSKQSLPNPDEFVPVEKMPEVKVSAEPVYPEEAEDAGIGGEVVVKALVDKTGAVRKALVAKSSGNEQLDKAAIDAAMKTEYKPAMRDDKPVAVWVSYKVTFTLAEKTESPDTEE